MTDHLGDAPDYHAWAGRGPCATAILESQDVDAMEEYRAAVNEVVATLVADGMDPVDALATGYDPETLARDITITWHADCACGAAVSWTTAAWEPRETEAPISLNGRIECEDCCREA